MTLTKFNDEMMLRFVRAYKSATCLWDTKHTSYKDRKLRSTMYHYLAEVMNIPGFTVNDVKNKIKNMRSMYCQELKRIHSHTMMGLEPYVPTTVWFSEFHEFMSSNVMQRSTHSTDYTMMNSEYRACECVLPESQSNSDVPCVVSSVTSINGDMPGFNSDLSQTIDGVQDRYSATTNYGIRPSVEMMLGRLESLSQSLVRQQKKSKEDEFDCFGRSVAQQLRKLPLVSAMRLKTKIQTLLSEERINCLGENSKKKTSEQNVDDVIVMEGEENKQNTEKITEDDVIMQEGEENKVNSEKQVECIEIIMDDEETEKAEQTEKVVENTIKTVDEREERPSSRASELSLHVSCSSSDDEESEREC